MHVTAVKLFNEVEYSRNANRQTLLLGGWQSYICLEKLFALTLDLNQG